MDHSLIPYEAPVSNVGVKNCSLVEFLNSPIFTYVGYCRFVFPFFMLKSPQPHFIRFSRRFCRGGGLGSSGFTPK
jgi:hypothetical protein